MPKDSIGTDCGTTENGLELRLDGSHEGTVAALGGKAG
jgi:hypothetical protein